MSRYKKEIILICVPLIFGYLVGVFIWLYKPFIFQVIFGLFWFWVGMHFAKLQMSKLKSIFFGNMIWAISLFLFIWQFVLIDDTERNIHIAGISQYYVFPFLWISRKFHLLITDQIHGTTIILFAYVAMLLTFVGGFVFARLRNSK